MKLLNKIQEHIKRFRWYEQVGLSRKAHYRMKTHDRNAMCFTIKTLQVGQRTWAHRGLNENPQYQSVVDRMLPQGRDRMPGRPGGTGGCSQGSQEEARGLQVGWA